MDHEYWFNVNALEIDFRKFIDELKHSSSSKESDERNTVDEGQVVEVKLFNLAFM